jgi:predicted nucleotidyltransferase component of viral defense system
VTCYGLDRFSEDIDLDGTTDKSIGEYIAEYCAQEGYFYRTAKDTETVKRYLVNYGNQEKPLKVKTSFRRKIIGPEEKTEINGIAVYTIETICAMKAMAYSGRDRIRDLYDLSFICDRYWDSLPNALILAVRNAVAHKGIEHFDYIVRDQSDELIDSDKLADSFLNMYDKLGLLRGLDDDVRQGKNNDRAEK